MTGKARILDFRWIAVLITMIFILSVQSLQSQSSLGSNIYKAYITGDINSWERIVFATSEPASDVEALYEYSMAYYGLIGYCLERGMSERAKKYLSKAIELSDKLLDMKPQDPRFNALGGAVLGFRMGFKKYLIPLLGPKSAKLINRALDLNPDSPQALVESGNKDWHMPAFFGGDKERAIKEFEMAIHMMDEDPIFTNRNWYYLNVQMILAGWYEKLGIDNRARGIYLKLLKIEPEFGWCREKMEER